MSQEGGQLGNRNVVELLQPLTLRNSLRDQDRVQAFQIGENHQLLQGGLVAKVAVGARVVLAPFLRGHAKQGHVEQVGLGGVDETFLLAADLGRDQVFLDGVGMDEVIYLGEGALEVLGQLEAVVFLIFEALELFDEVDFENGTDRRAKLKGDVNMRISTSVSPRLGLNPDGICFFDPL